MNTAHDDWTLHALVAGQLRTQAPLPDRANALRASLFARVHQSALAHRSFQTVRVDDGDWQTVAPGVARRLLREDAVARVEIQRLDAGATLPWPDGAHAQEILLLQGAIVSGGQPATPAGLPGAVGYAVRQRSTSETPWIAATDCSVYVRHCIALPGDLPPLEDHWWQIARANTAWVDPATRRWLPTSDGVAVIPLRGDNRVVSMLVRFAAGASVADHHHALDEDCLVLQGEMFLGDILLRTGDYQLAPAGGSHFGETSDCGVMFFFHGALDPVLLAAPGAGPAAA